MSVRDPQFDWMDPHSSPRRPVVRFDAIREAWHWLQAEWFTWAVAMIVVLLGNSLTTKVIDSFFHLGNGGGMGGFRWPMPREEMAVQVILGALINGFFVGGLFRMACRQVRGERIGVNDLFSVINVLGELALGSVLCAAAVAITSFFCFVIPGLIVHGLLMFTLPLIVDGGLPATTAMRSSWHALKGQWLTAAVFHVVTSFLSSLGVVFCCVGLLVTGPLYVLSVTVLYRDFFLTKGVSFQEKPAPPYSDF